MKLSPGLHETSPVGPRASRQRNSLEAYVRRWFLFGIVPALLFGITVTIMGYLLWRDFNVLGIPIALAVGGGGYFVLRAQAKKLLKRKPT
jgi:hypothetical protein